MNSGDTGVPMATGGTITPSDPKCVCPRTYCGEVGFGLGIADAATLTFTRAGTRDGGWTGVVVNDFPLDRPYPLSPLESNLMNF